MTTDRTTPRHRETLRERRQHRRGPVRGRALIYVDDDDGGAIVGDIENLSRTGGLFHIGGDRRVAPGTHITVAVELLGCSATLPGTVLRHEGPRTRLAVEFDPLASAIADSLHACVLRALESAECPTVVVVVDPLPGERSRVADAIRRAGFDPVEASTPLEALEALDRPDHRVAAAAIRDTLTQTDGGELAGYLAEQHPSVPVAILADSEDATTTVAGPHEVPVLPIDGDLSEPMRTLVNSGKHDE